MRIAQFLTLSLALSACSTGGDADAFREVLPDNRLLINMPVDFGGSARSNLGDESEYYVLTADATLDINQIIGDVLDGVGEITDFDPTWSNDGGNKALWGPWEDGDINGRLWVRELADGSFDWALEAKRVAEGEDAYLPVFAGQVDSGSDADISGGRFAIDFGALSTFDPSEDLTGEFYVDYAVDGDMSEVMAGWQDFSENGGEPVDAGYHYTQDDTGGSMDLVVEADATGNDVAELNIIRSRWNDTGAGRTDAYLTEGDLGALVYTAAECWDSSYSVVYFEENYSLTSVGDEAQCVFTDAEFSDSSTAPAVR